MHLTPRSLGLAAAAAFTGCTLFGILTSIDLVPSATAGTPSTATPPRRAGALDLADRSDGAATSAPTPTATTLREPRHPRRASAGDSRLVSTPPPQTTPAASPTAALASATRDPPRRDTHDDPPGVGVVQRRQPPRRAPAARHPGADGPTRGRRRLLRVGANTITCRA
jgi:hypothetical protein